MLFFFLFPQPFLCSILFTKPCNNLAPFTFGSGFVGGFIMNSGLETFNSL